MSRKFELIVDLDERGEYAATLYDGDKVVASIDTDDLRFFVECMGFKHGRDVGAYWTYFNQLGMINQTDSLRITG
jgi:hypothetical protein